LRDVRLYLEDVLEAISRIEEYTANMSFDDLAGNRLVVDGVVRNLEVIGEACRALPEEMREMYADVEWRKITGLRNILIHNYFGIDLEIIYDLIRNNLPDLKNRILEILKETGGEPH
jgi:uncharacterized protein with HEPN domain